MAYRNLTAGQVDVSVEVAVLRGKVGYGAAYLAVGDVGVVRMSFGEDKPGLAGVGAEELWDEGGFVGTFGGFLYVVFGDLDGFATAVPAVGWIIGAPERVVDALGDTVEGAVLVADAFVSGGLVAEVWEEVLETDMTMQETNLGYHLEWASIQQIISANSRLLKETWEMRDTLFFKLLLDNPQSIGL